MGACCGKLWNILRKKQPETEVLPLLDLPEHLILSIFKKMTAVSFVRMRRTCHFLDSFTEGNRRLIRILLAKESFLLMYHKHPVQKNDGEEQEDTHLIIRKEFGNSEHSFKTPLTYENRNEVCNRISGFGFNCIGVVRPPRNDDEEDKTFYERFEVFFQIASDHKKRSVTLYFWNIEDSILERLQKMTKSDHLSIRSHAANLFHPRLARNLRRLFLRVENFASATVDIRTNFNINEYIAHSSCAHLELEDCPSQSVVRGLNSFLKDWCSGISTMDQLNMNYVDDISLHGSMDWLPMESVESVVLWKGRRVNLGKTINTGTSYLPYHTNCGFGLFTPFNVKIWLIKGENPRTGETREAVIGIVTTQWFTGTRTNVFFRSLGKNKAKTIADLVPMCVTNCPPVNLQKLKNAVDKCNTPEEVSQTFGMAVEQLINMTIGPYIHA